MPSLPCLRGGAATCLAAVILLGAATARAAPPGADDEAVALAMFEEAKRLMEEGRSADACPKLEETARLEPGWIGTLEWLGQCYERTGRLASAWTAYDRMASLACDKPGRARECDTAREKTKTVAPRRATLVLVVPSEVGELPGVVVERDGAVAGPAQWNLPLPIDAGKHHLKVTAAGKKPWEAEVDVPPDASQRRADVPRLEDAPSALPSPIAPPPAPSPVAEASPPPARVPAWAWVTGAAGLAMLGTSAAFLVDERSVQSAIDQHCGPTVCDTKDGFQVKVANAHLWRSYALFVGFGVGGLLSVGASAIGIAVRGKPPSRSTAGLEVRPDAWIAPGAGWAGVRAQF